MVFCVPMLLNMYFYYNIFDTVRNSGAADKKEKKQVKIILSWITLAINQYLNHKNKHEVSLQWLPSKNLDKKTFLSKSKICVITQKQVRELFPWASLIQILVQQFSRPVKHSFIQIAAAPLKLSCSAKICCLNCCIGVGSKTKSWPLPKLDWLVWCFSPSHGRLMPSLDSSDNSMAPRTSPPDGLLCQLCSLNLLVSTTLTSTVSCTLNTSKTTLLSLNFSLDETCNLWDIHEF